MSSHRADRLQALERYYATRRRVDTIIVRHHIPPTTPDAHDGYRTARVLSTDGQITEAVLQARQTLLEEGYALTPL